MVDTLTPKERSAHMARIGNKNSRAEMVVRRASHALGFRHRLHVKTLPGKPDLAYPARRKVVFVHGCWWHKHDCKAGARVPKTNIEFWLRKLDGNERRDARVLAELRALGWDPLVIWECEATAGAALNEKLLCFLNGMSGATP